MGYSAILAATTMRKYAPDARVWSLELNPEYAVVLEDMVKFAGLENIVTIVVGPASDSLKNLKDDGSIKQLDMVLIDHVEDLYIQEFQTLEALGMLKIGTTIVADNVVRPGAPQYRDFVRKHKMLKSVWNARSHRSRRV